MNDYSSNLHDGMWWNPTTTTTTTTTTPKSSSQSQQNATWGAHWLGTLNSLSTQESAASSYRNNGSIFHPKDEHSSSLTEEDDEEMEQPQQPQVQEMEHMFEKPLTPSDVGKLNRLVIPKQHAEKYFPLSRVESVEKGLLLSFEDESGKLWRFRYSYWNSSQSYVLTKGWSRFVKEKQLDAGDVVSFERRRPDGEQLYIRWRRRVTPPVHDSRLSQSVTAPSPTTNTNTTPIATTTNTSSAWTRVYYSTHPYPSHHHHLRGPLLYQPDCLHAAEPILQNPVRKAPTKKQVRLFGVNLDCQLDEPEPPGPADVLSYSNQMYSHAHDLNHHTHTQQDSNFSREYYYQHQMRNYPGGSGDMPI